jgi:hypothetical protein
VTTYEICHTADQRETERDGKTSCNGTGRKKVSRNIIAKCIISTKIYLILFVLHLIRDCITNCSGFMLATPLSVI